MHVLNPYDYSLGASVPGSLQDLFWHKVIIDTARTLIVLDNVNSISQIHAFLPEHGQVPHKCHILAISVLPLAQQLDDSAVSVKLGPFSKEEARDFFRLHVNSDLNELYEEPFYEISHHLGYIPQLLAVAAHDIAHKHQTPAAYLTSFREREQNLADRQEEIPESIALALKTLGPEHRQILDTIGVLGESDWSDTMVAAISLRRIDQVRDILAELTQRELIQQVTPNRYKVNLLQQSAAQRGFRSLPDYMQRAIYTLLAHYCLSLAQDVAAELNTARALRDEPIHQGSGVDELFVGEFRNALLPEMAHVRQVLRWAIQNKEWELVRRWSHSAFYELLGHLSTNGYEVQLSLTLATLHEPLVRPLGERLALDVAHLSLWSSWMYCGPDKIARQGNISNAVHEIWEGPIPDDEDRCSDLSITIQCGCIANGVFDTARLVDARWTGVRATGILCHKVDLVGGSLTACDLSHSVWVSCDARRVTLWGTMFSHSLLRDMCMRSADLRGARLVGAVLEDVDLRGANLSGADLRGAVLNNVDLRGANLFGADLSFASGRGIRLDGCNAEQTLWQGNKIEAPMTSDRTLLHMIARGNKQTPPDALPPIQRRVRPIGLLRQEKSLHFTDADLRGAELAKVDLSHDDLVGADLRLAQLSGATLHKVRLSNANLRAARMANANLEEAVLRSADLSAADLTKAVLERADLSAAQLCYAWLVNASLQNANLARANLQSANLTNTNLQHASLSIADLSRSSLVSAKLQHANLSGANLSGANLAGADLSEAELAGAICIEANFAGCVLSDKQIAAVEQLAGATLPGGEIVVLLDGYYKTRLSTELMPYLRFAQLSGTFEEVGLVGADLFGAHLNGLFARVDLSQANLSYARLSGTFSRTEFRAADLSNARLRGDFARSNFSEANFHNADLRDVSFVNTDLRGARHLGIEQLKSARRLRQAKLPDGSLYVGQFALAGDIEDATRFGYNPEDEEDMNKHFYTPGRPKPRM